MLSVKSTDRISAIRSTIVLQRWLGIWKWRVNNGDNWKQLKKIYPLLLHLPLTFTYIALMWLELLKSEGIDQVGNVMYMSLTELALIIKIINIWYRMDQAFYFVEELEHHLAYKLLTKDEIRFWQREQNLFKLIFTLYIGGSLLVALTGYISVLFQDTYELPFGYYVPFQWRNPELYFYAWSYNVVAMTLCCLSNCLLDAMGCYFMFHITLLYRLLGIRFLELQHLPEEKGLPKLRDIFQLHKRVNDLTEQCQMLVSPYVVSQIILSAFIICFSGYRLVQMDWQRNPGIFVTTLQFIAVMVVQIFLPCYYGNELTICAYQLTNKAFNTNWIEYSVATRKLIICYMEFQKRSVKLRAGSFFEIGIPIFMKTINNAYSFFALIINLSK